MRCVIYTGYISNAGYGLAYDPDTKKTITAHRLAFKQANGYLPSVVMHTCDVPSCINPEHLKAGTQSDNIKDCVAKGRHVKNGKLTDGQVLQIMKDSRSSYKVARDYHVDPTTILNIRNGRFYKHLTGELCDR